MGQDVIRIGGAREHNLKNVSLTIPRNRLVVFTGLSGSGKSSLAFDTIFAEGQRKYVESLSAYARQFLDQMQRPDVDFIEGLSPAIAIEQRTSGSNPRSTIATTTEIFDYLRLLFANAGQAHCPDTGEPIRRQTTSDIIDRLLALPPKTRVILLAPIVRGEKGEFRDVLDRLAREGFVRARVDGVLVELAENARPRLDPKKSHTVDVVVDRLVVDDRIRGRLTDSVETTLKWGEGSMLVLHQPPTSPTPAVWEEMSLANRNFSPTTGRTFEVLTAKHFSFNSPHGACPVCQGLGQKMVFDPALIVPDPNKSIEQGAVLPWRRGGKRMIVYYKALLRGVAQHAGVSLETPWKDLPADFHELILRGSADRELDFVFLKGGTPSKVRRTFEGVVPNLERLYHESESEFTRNRLKAFMSPTDCDACHGHRLNPQVLAVTLGDNALARRYSPQRTPLTAAPGLSIMDLCHLSVDHAWNFLGDLTLSPQQQSIVSEVLHEIRSRLGFLRNVGLGYLTLNRESGTLSGGEAQRIRLATQIGAGLVGVLYILDEPSIGLHQRDNDRLLQTLVNLRDLGNSVLVVEHDEDTIRQADFLVDLGPGAGVHGGEIVAAGTPVEVLQSKASLTARYLTGELSVPIPKRRASPSKERGWIEILGASENNLAHIDVRIPLGTLTCVTGVSGSGKSTLVDDILRRTLFRQWYHSKERPGAHREMRGIELLDKVVVIDQAPIGRTPRSNPATFTGLFNEIRDLFSQLPAARIRGYGPGRFSFNVRGGRCEACEGDGVIRIEMHFLPPVYVTCEKCGGKRYNRETLEITYKGLNIADVLQLTVDEALTFFRSIPNLHDVCATLAEVGLGYLRLGQAGTTLSGGEAQRLKLAAELSRKYTGRTLYLLDEPTTGLHFHDVAKLLEVLFKLRDAGNSLVVIEHNLDVIKTADWIIDLGPEGGTGGGRIVAEGPPEQIALADASHTGRYLRAHLARTRHARPASDPPASDIAPVAPRTP
ncbi:MAG: excinuclease ABC subunit UvrA [Verrucomicrobiales bacterium]|nr:excinuclease ABC subunit UvrA [Verrucomicrobiales bacterium]